jgi:hypothetical protein
LIESQNMDSWSCLRAQRQVANMKMIVVYYELMTSLGFNPQWLPSYVVGSFEGIYLNFRKYQIYERRVSRNNIGYLIIKDTFFLRY